MSYIFSFPLSPYMRDEEYTEVYLPFVQEYSAYIYDIYATIRIPPFLHDAMGGELQSEQLLEKALRVQRDTGKILSATFNDITIPATQSNLELFCEQFAPLYEAGIRSVSIPFTHWMLSGEISHRFPDLTVKNSVLNTIDNPQGYWDSAMAGYDVVNLDRKLLRDKEALTGIKKAQELFRSRYGFAPLTQILANEHCIGRCPVMSEHYTINCTGAQYFDDAIAAHSCRRWKSLDESYPYRVANISPFRDDIDEILSLVDLLKLHGRGGTALLQESMQIIGDFAKGKELFELGVGMWNDVAESKISTWRNTIKTCRFQCWSCNVCDEMVNPS